MDAPSTVIVPAGPSSPNILAFAYPNESALSIVPFIALTVLKRASPLRSKNFGAAVTDRMPKIIMTTSNSINVKPFCFFTTCFPSNVVASTTSYLLNYVNNI